MISILSKHDATNYWNLRLQALQMNPEAFATTYEEALKKENPVDEVTKNLESQTSFTFGAFDKQGYLLGVVTLLTEQKLAFQHKGHIVAMYVDAKNRGNGYARSLIQAVIEKARECNMEQLTLAVVSNNEVAKKLYQSCGFTTYGVEKRALKMNDVYRDEEHMVLFL